MCHTKDRCIPSEARRVFAKSMKRIRTEEGVTLERLHKMTGLSYNYLSDVERLVANISIDNAEKIAIALGTSLHAMTSPL